MLGDIRKHPRIVGNTTATLPTRVKLVERLHHVAPLQGGAAVRGARVEHVVPARNNRTTLVESLACADEKFRSSVQVWNTWSLRQNQKSESECDYLGRAAHHAIDDVRSAHKGPGIKCPISNQHQHQTIKPCARNLSPGPQTLPEQLEQVAVPRLRPLPFHVPLRPLVDEAQLDQQARQAAVLHLAAQIRNLRRLRGTSVHVGR